jgi:putative glutamine amidotransferase
MLVPPGDVDAGLELLERSDALLLTGGADVDPDFYGAKPGPKMGRTERERDELEIRLLKTALERGQPVFGICRGLQVINVGLGGTLYQDVPSEYLSDVEHNTKPRAGNPRLAHTVQVAGGTRLASIAGAGELAVNSFHHQAVKGLAAGVRATAVSPDGLVEGLETSDGRLLAVQCHPEELTHLCWAAALFDAFVKQAAGSRSVI